MTSWVKVVNSFENVARTKIKRKRLNCGSKKPKRQDNNQRNDVGRHAYIQCECLLPRLRIGSGVEETIHEIESEGGVIRGKIVLDISGGSHSW